MAVWKSDLPDKMKWDFFPVVTVSVLLNRCTSRTLTKHMEKKIDGNYKITLRLGNSTLQNSNCTSTYLLSHRPFQKNEQDLLGSGEEVRTN